MKQVTPHVLYQLLRRAPHGARGLKHPVTKKKLKGSWSRPAWGAWIETLIGRQVLSILVSRPAWGAWIETNLFVFRRGGAVVAPRMGRVD